MSDLSTSATGVVEDPRATAARLAPILKALADETRLTILLTLTERPRSVVELTEVLDLGQTTVSHHLKALRDTGLVVATPVGRSNVYELCCDVVSEPIRLLSHLSAARPTCDEGCAP